MKYYISYFYQIRFFTPRMIPLSTALFDPAWFHDSHDENYIFKDSNGVINGYRLTLLNPRTEECRANCPFKGQSTCDFKKHYKEHLDSIDFKWFKETLEKDAGKIASRWGITDPVIVFIVYETPDNPCSERAGLIQWFKDNGVELEEWHPVAKTKRLVNLLA